MNIKILGIGCPNCQKLERNVRQAIEELKIEAEVEKVTDIPEMMGYGLMQMPGLVINGKLEMSGRVFETEEIKEFLSK
ncbi:MAG TPA: thioredoxin family protein [Candidatus Moranbacteria bacterium]|nr:MAG: Redox-active disulfide protein 2 [Candidatus Moranbacteria bacterium GW2011_GWC2_45_10]KKT95043.1 MAG: redox-active disulfide protein 2 [Parcubacteria group bacterium GW2011_GWC1_45_14]HAV11507.1 thioredoxin family protein [Candidatus Moranbacteria bacterium]